MKEAKLFMNGKSQAVRLPKAFRFPGTSVFVKRHGSGVLLLPAGVDPWAEMTASLGEFAPDLELTREQGVHQKRPAINVARASQDKQRVSRKRS